MSQKIAIYANHIPPEYSGSGYRALEHAKWLHSINKLSFIVTDTQKFSPTGVPTLPLMGLNWLNNKITKVRPLKLLIFYYQVIRTLFPKCSTFNILHSFNGNGFASVFVKMGVKKNFRSIVEVTVSSKKMIGVQKFNPFQHLRSWTWKRCDALVAISPKIYNEFKERGVDESKCYLIPNGVDTSRFYHSVTKYTEIRKKYNISSNEIVLLSIGEICDRKGSDISFRILVELLEEYNDVRLFFVGEYDGIYFDRFGKDFTQLVESGNIIITGIVDNPEDFINAADFFLFPSRKEGLGNAPLEAMACKKMVVSNFIKGITDYYIDHDVTGYLIRDNNLPDYVLTIKEMLDNPTKKKRIEEAAFKWITNNMTQEIIYDKYIDLYNEVS